MSEFLNADGLTDYLCDRCEEGVMRPVVGAVFNKKQITKRRGQWKHACSECGTSAQFTDKRYPQYTNEE